MRPATIAGRMPALHIVSDAIRGRGIMQRHCAVGHFLICGCLRVSMGYVIMFAVKVKTLSKCTG